jgi:hypothetical protein
VGKPVIEVVIANLFLRAAVRFHAPDLHRSAADGIEVDIFAVRRIFRPIV